MPLFTWYICHYLLLYPAISLKILIENLTWFGKLVDSFFLLHSGWLLINLFVTGYIGDWKIPYWYFWYLLSLFCWKWMGLLILFITSRVSPKRTRIFKLFLIIISIIIGCFSGAIWWIGKDFSLSRTLVFFPFYCTGLCCSKKLINRIKAIQPLRKLLFTCSAFIIAFILGSQLLSFVPITFLYHAQGFKVFSLSILLGVQARLICYIVAALLGFVILALTPSKQLWISKFGADTYPVYIAHGLLMPANIFAPSSTIGSLLYFAAIIVGFIYLVYRIVGWGRNS